MASEALKLTGLPSISLWGGHSRGTRCCSEVTSSRLTLFHFQFHSSWNYLKSRPWIGACVLVTLGEITTPGSARLNQDPLLTSKRVSHQRKMIADNCSTLWFKFKTPHDLLGLLQDRMGDGGAVSS
ncbi:hypothetical protein CEXT_116481 [Caerostris extrusa]|uniref:Uncharacterized protein n=1 Tax=Caerostris extrusa TaxID=172846 RepID=A0AAV4VEQ0_CAEEX|nr:hypothetical protein CEXT_116481 [Caerostris extrusa]